MRRLAPSPSLGCWSYRPADLPWESMYYVKRYMFIQICSSIPSALSVAWLLGALHMRYRYENLISICYRAKVSMRSSLTFAVFIIIIRHKINLNSANQFL